MGTQVVAGTNYCILCRVTPVAPDAEGSFCLVAVYRDVSGRAEMTEIHDLDIAGGVSDSTEQ